MNFFEHQQHARIATRWLLTLFALAVLGVVLVVNAALAWGLGLGNLSLDLRSHAIVALVVIGLIGGGALRAWARLRHGGDAVAGMIEARAVDPGTRDPLERRLLNVVEEMALASGTPVPPVYLMDREAAINAFAAGHSPNDAIVAVTQGTLSRLSRAELQGVVAHEFSHILNGDMRLNMRLIAMIHGLTALSTTGRLLAELGDRKSSSDSKELGALAIAGFALWAIGYIGVLFGRMIKAAVSRQREFLADASAVQFTRDPSGIGGALRKIGGLVPAAQGASRRERARDLAAGSLIGHRHAETLSHLFLGAPRLNFASGWLATHPPLAKRIARIYGRPMGMLAASEMVVPDAGDAPALAQAGEMPIMLVRDDTRSSSVIDAIGQPMAHAQAGPYAASWRDCVRTLGLDEALQDTTQARLVVLAMLLDAQPDLARQQAQTVASALGRDAADALGRLQIALQGLPPGGRLPLLDMMSPALRRLPVDDADALLALVTRLIATDGRMSLTEFLLSMSLRRRIGRRAREPVRPQYPSVQSLHDDASRVLSLVAHLGRARRPPAQAFDAARVHLPGVDLVMMATGGMRHDAIAASLDRLNRLMPLAKPAFIKACAAAAWQEGCERIDWRAASTLRMICACLDAPMPPLALAAVERVH